MNYIINPMWFYWINVVDTLRCIAIIAIIISAIATLVLALIALVNSDWKDDDVYQFAVKAFKRMIILLIISSVAFAFLPSKATLIEIQIARYATQENAELTIDVIKSAVDYIVQTIQGVGK